MNHGQKPKPIAFYWEFWGNRLCANHTWVAWPPDGNEYSCPDLPLTVAVPCGGTSLIQISDGVMSMYMLRTYQFGSDAIHEMDWDPNADNPNVGLLRIKLRALHTLLSQDSNIGMFIADADNNYAFILFAKHPSYTANPPFYYVGDNGGDFFDIGLPACGLTNGAAINSMYFWMTAAAQNDECLLTLDYFTFTPV